MAQRRRRPRPSVLLLVLLLCALAVGAAVSLLASARTAGPPPPVGPTTELLLPPWAISAAIFGFGLAIILPIAYFALRSPKGPGLDTRYIVGALSLLLAIIVAIALLHLAGGGSVFSTGVGSPTNSTAHNNSTVPPKNGTPVSGGGGVLSNFNFHPPPWLLFALVSVALVGVAVAAVPSLSEYLADRRESRNLRFRSDEVKAAVQSALRDAARDLGSALDPRALILALYATLLVRIEPLATDLDRSTAEEIRLLHLTRLGIRPSAAEDLTRVFEEARYSSHPLGPDEVRRATAAIRTAERDLESSETTR